MLTAIFNEFFQKVCERYDLETQKISEAYELGEEYAKIAENRFFFGHKLTPDNTDHLYPVDKWNNMFYRIRKQKKGFGFLEKVAFEIGDDNFTRSKPPEFTPSEPWGILYNLYKDRFFESSGKHPK